MGSTLVSAAMPRSAAGHIETITEIAETMKKHGRKIAFAFDIDGVLILGKETIPGAVEILKLLQKLKIPFILLTNGGGCTEEQYGTKLALRLGVDFSTEQVVLAHSPFRALVPEYHDKPILAIGGKGQEIRNLALAYGFKKVIISSDVYVDCPSIFPFADATREQHFEEGKRYAPSEDLAVRAVLVFSSPRFDASLDQLVMSDLAAGCYQRFSAEEPPRFYCSNQDLVFKSEHPHPRPAQGALMTTTETLHKAMWDKEFPEIEWCGKPTAQTYVYAEAAILDIHRRLSSEAGEDHKIDSVFMIGDNPASDIRGSNNHNRLSAIQWTSVLVETGVYEKGTEPAFVPDYVKEDVASAVLFAFQKAAMDLEKELGRRLFSGEME